MSEYSVIHRHFADIAATYEGTVWTPTTIEAQNEYDTLLDEAEEQDNLFNGPLVRVKETEQEDDVLYLDLEETNYFSHVVTRDHEDYGKQERADPISVGVRLRTEDDHLVLGEKSSLNEVGEGEFQVPAGFVTPPEMDDAAWADYLLDEARREMDEEVNVSADTVEQMAPASLIGANTHQPMLVYDAETALSTETVAHQWSAIDDAEKEFSQLAFLDDQQPERAANGSVPVRYATWDGDTVDWRHEQESLDLRPHAAGAVASYDGQ